MTQAVRNKAFPALLAQHRKLSVRKETCFIYHFGDRMCPDSQFIAQMSIYHWSTGVKKKTTPLPVRMDLMGDNAPSVAPGDDPSFYGSAVLSETSAVEVRTFQTFTLVYTVGHLGLDDTGAIRLSFRVVTDAGLFQAEHPARANYVSASTNGEGHISVSIGPHGPRPWNNTITAQLNGGYLKEGDQIMIVLGDTTQGGPGMLMQTFAEHGYEIRVAADVQATGNFQPLLEQFAIPVVAGPAHKWVAVLPTLRRAGEAFHFGLKAEDAYGNPTPQASGRVRLEPSMPVKGLITEFDYAPNDRAMTLEGLCVQESGMLTVKVFVDGVEVCETRPLLIEDSPFAHFWGDLHGQTGETVGVNTIESYFDFARNKAFLDVSSHQANDFQITPVFWKHLNALTAECDDPGRFTVLPGYEWSGNTSVGGDHNVFFSREGRQIARCSHALLEDRSEIDSDAHTLTELFNRMRDTDTVIYGHVGGRYCNIHYDHDPSLETSVELHSAWGTFEWVLTDGFELGRRVGVVCNSDGHKGRPGASYPGASEFGAYGGLTCFLTDRNDRASIMEAQRRRHHYGTTGCRLFMDVTAELPPGSVVYDRNPVVDTKALQVESSRAIMGDIVAVAGSSIRLNVRLRAHAGIEKAEVRAGKETMDTFRPYTEHDLGNRYRVLVSGAEYRGRGRNTHWSGRTVFEDAIIKHMAPINHWNTERMLEQRGSNSVVFDTITTGNFMGFDVWLEEGAMPLFKVDTNHGNMSIALSDIGIERVSLEAGGLERRLTIQRLPDAALPKDLDLTTSVQIEEIGDTPVWIAVTTEDGFQAWSSPIYAYRKR